MHGHLVPMKAGTNDSKNKSFTLSSRSSIVSTVVSEQPIHGFV